jgi:cysteine synthase A
MKASQLFSSVVEAMEESPLVSLDRLTSVAGVEGKILAKLDYLLPGFSKKDRAARKIIEDARASGELRSGQTVVELTSGNMGTGLAIVCAVLGHPFVAVMSAGNSPERARMMHALGAEVVLVPQTAAATPGKVSGADLDLVEIEAQRLTKARNAFRADQFEREGNRVAYRDGTGAEILRQSGGAVTAFCDFVGTGGSLAGCAAAFSAAGADVRCYAAEPEGAEAIAGGDVSHPDHPIQGGGYARSTLTHLRDLKLAGTVVVSGKAARDTARLLARTEGVFGGYSGGANVAAALDLLRGRERGGVVAVIIPDSGLKYLSTDLWE